jgi:hypothetical protein
MFVATYELSFSLSSLSHKLSLRWSCSQSSYFVGGGVFGWTRYFQPTMQGRRGLPLGKMVRLCPFKVVCTRQDAIVFEDPPIVMTLVSRFHIGFIPTWRWRNTIIYANDNILVISSSLCVITCFVHNLLKCLCNHRFDAFYFGSKLKNVFERVSYDTSCWYRKSHKDHSN